MIFLPAGLLLNFCFQSGIRKLQPDDAEQVGDAVMEAILRMLSVSKVGGVQEDAFMAMGSLVEGIYPQSATNITREK